MIKAMLIKESLLIVRDRHALAALFIMPAVFILIMSLALKDAFDEERVLMRYAIVDIDDSSPSRTLLGLLESEKALEKKIFDEHTTAEARLVGGEIDFIVTIPERFSRQFTLNAEDPPKLRVEVAPDVSPDKAAMFEAKITAHIMAMRLEALKKSLGTLAPRAADAISGVSADTKGVISVAYYNYESQKQRPSSVQQSVPSWIVFGMFFVIIPLSTIFINEQRQNTLVRLRAMNVSLPMLFAGKVIPYFIINQLQVWVMIAVGMLVVPLFGADALGLGNSIAGLLLVSMGLSCAAIGVALLIAVSVESVEQATTIGGLINILLGAIGGIMVPTFVMPPFMQTFSQVSPMAWGLEGFLDIFVRGLGAADVLPESAKLAGFGILLLIAAAAVFRYKQGRMG